MVRPIGLVCGGVFFLLLAGCTLDSFTVPWTSDAARREHTFNGSLDSVASVIQSTLRNQGLFCTYSWEEDSLRLESATSTGDKFILGLKRKKADAGEQTVVRVQWVKNPDEKFWLALLEAVGNQLSQPSDLSLQRPQPSSGFYPGKL